MKTFISHSSKDKAFVERLATDLRVKDSIDAWLDKWEITPGDAISEKLEEGLQEATVLLFILSPDSVDSEWVSRERSAWLNMQIEDERAAKREGRKPGKRLIPVLYKDCKIPVFLKDILYVQINDRDYNEGYTCLVDTIQGRNRRPPLGSQAASENTSPPVESVKEPKVAKSSALKLLNGLLSAEFKQVLFYYDMPDNLIPTGVCQNDQAIELIKYARRQEGPDLLKLLETIYEIAPYLKK